MSYVLAPEERDEARAMRSPGLFPFFCQGRFARERGTRPFVQRNMIAAWGKKRGLGI